MRTLLLLTTISIFLSCKKEKSESCNRVDIYLLRSYQSFSGRCGIFPNTAVLEDLPLITNREIVKYSEANQEYTVTKTAIEKLKALDHHTVFAVTVNKKVIFFGLYIPKTMSYVCTESILLDINSTNKFFLHVNPAFFYQQIPDLRNDPLLIAALACQGKLQR